MSIFDFLFARGATPEQRDKNIFLDMIDGGGRFDADDEFKGGPLGISALLNALGVNPYGSTDTQPQDKPQGPASAPRPVSTLSPFALGPPGEITTTVLPPAITARLFDGAGFGYTAPPPAPPMGTSFGNLGNPVDMNRVLGLLAPQVAQEVATAPPVDYLATAMQYPEFQRYVDAMAHRNLTREQLALQFLKIAEATPQ